LASGKISDHYCFTFPSHLSLPSPFPSSLPYRRKGGRKRKQTKSVGGPGALLLTPIIGPFFFSSLLFFSLVEKWTTNRRTLSYVPEAWTFEMVGPACFAFSPPLLPFPLFLRRNQRIHGSRGTQYWRGYVTPCFFSLLPPFSPPPPFFPLSLPFRN